MDGCGVGMRSGRGVGGVDQSISRSWSLSKSTATHSSHRYTAHSIEGTKGHGTDLQPPGHGDFGAAFPPVPHHGVVACCNGGRQNVVPIGAFRRNTSSPAFDAPTHPHAYPTTTHCTHAPKYTSPCSSSSRLNRARFCPGGRWSRKQPLGRGRRRGGPPGVLLLALPPLHEPPPPFITPNWSDPVAPPLAASKARCRAASAAPCLTVCASGVERGLLMPACGCDKQEQGTEHGSLQPRPHPGVSLTLGSDLLARIGRARPSL